MRIGERADRDADRVRFGWAPKENRTAAVWAEVLMEGPTAASRARVLFAFSGDVDVAFGIIGGNAERTARAPLTIKAMTGHDGVRGALDHDPQRATAALGYFAPTHRTLFKLRIL